MEGPWSVIALGPRCCQGGRLGGALWQGSEFGSVGVHPLNMAQRGLGGNSPSHLINASLPTWERFSPIPVGI